MKAAALALIVLAGCGGPDTIEREPLPTADCAGACARFAECNRPEAEPAADGTTCTQLCEEVQRLGLPVLSPECVVATETCEEIDQCPSS